MKRVGIVVPRSHPSVVGGAETLARQWASLLRARYPVELLTTRALDLATWANEAPEGTTVEEGITVRRFSVSRGRSDYWRELHRRLMTACEELGVSDDSARKTVSWTLALQEEFIYRQGPYSHDLCRFLAEDWRQYRALIMMPYLYPTTYFSARLVPPELFLLVPLLHDEAPARLSVFGLMARRARTILWNTSAERSFGESLWGALPGRIAGMGIETGERAPASLGFPYLLYCGRIDLHKGCDELVKYFLRYKEERPSALRLVLTGKDELGLPSNPDIDFRGHVPEEEKFSLMAGSRLLVLLSPNESLSVSTLEAMAQKTPVLVSGKAAVLVDHVRASSAGFVCNDYADFAQAVDRVTEGQGEADQMGARGRDYVLANYSHDRVQRALFEAIEEAPTIQTPADTATAPAGDRRPR